MTKAKRNKIAPVSVFFILFISRIVVSLTSSQSVTTGFMAGDMLISILLAMILTLVISIPALLCVKNNKNPLDVKWVSAVYAVYFIYLAGVNISRFSYFAATTLNPDSKAWVFSVIVVVCAGYAAYLGIEGISRFSALGFALIVIAILSSLLLNIKGFEAVNLFPIIENDNNDILKNTLLIATSCSEIIIYLCISRQVNGKATKCFLGFIVASFVAIFLLILFVVGVMGDAARLQAFPLYTLFQTAKLSAFERIDVLYISLWIFGVFVKAAILIYCAGYCLATLRREVAVIISTALSFIASVYLSSFANASTSSALMLAIPSTVFCVIIPTLSLLLRKRKFGDDLIENS